MTDVDETVTGGNKVTITISKGRSGSLVAEPDKVTSEPHYIEIWRLGFQVLANRGMTSIKKENYKTEAEFKAAVMAKAEANRDAIYAGTFPLRGAKSKSDKVPAEIKKLAMDMCRVLTRAEIKRKGFKVSMVKSSVITKYAKAYLEANPQMYEKAAKQLEEQEQEAANSGGIDIEGIAEDPDLVAKAALAKQAKGLSAAKAANVAGRGRPGLRQ
jgi:hypothetical protein